LHLRCLSVVFFFFPVLFFVIAVLSTQGFG
jgi:hypothetical protein